MFERFFPGRAKEKDPLPEPTPQLALGVMLVRIALSDASYRPEEIKTIDAILADLNGLKPLEAAKLRATCEDLSREAAKPQEFLDILRYEVPYDDRLALADSMWKVLLSDGHHASIEEATLHQIEEALAITPIDRANAKARALGGTS